jgi:hypothetical protein
MAWRDHRSRKIVKKVNTRVHADGIQQQRFWVNTGSLKRCHKHTLECSGAPAESRTCGCGQLDRLQHLLNATSDSAWFAGPQTPAAGWRKQRRSSTVIASSTQPHEPLCSRHVQLGRPSSPVRRGSRLLAVLRPFSLPLQAPSLCCLPRAGDRAWVKPSQRRTQSLPRCWVVAVGDRVRCHCRVPPDLAVRSWWRFAGALALRLRLLVEVSSRGRVCRWLVSTFCRATWQACPVNQFRRGSWR